jgi:hypothetical protein
LLVAAHVVKPVPVLAWIDTLRYFDPELTTLLFTEELFILMVRDKSRMVVCEPEYAIRGTCTCLVTPVVGTVAEIFKFSDALAATGVPEESTCVMHNEAVG